MTLVVPELRALRELRHAFARGGMPTAEKRTPEDDVRLAAFRVVQELLRLFEELRRRIEGGERCRLVEREHPREPGQLRIEFAIEVQA